jgi:hypothetical protein
LACDRERAVEVGFRFHVWLTGWTTTIGGGQFVSLLVEIADKGGRPSR